MTLHVETGNNHVIMCRRCVSVSKVIEHFIRAENMCLKECKEILYY